jgi:hypothetical protein
MQKSAAVAGAEEPLRLLGIAAGYTCRHSNVYSDDGY